MYAFFRFSVRENVCVLEGRVKGLYYLFGKPPVHPCDISGFYMIRIIPIAALETPEYYFKSTVDMHTVDPE